MSAVKIRPKTTPGRLPEKQKRVRIISHPLKFSKVRKLSLILPLSELAEREFPFYS